MSGKELWARTRRRFKSFPQCVAACAEDAALYGRCVAAATSRGHELKKDMCAAEFQALKNCFTQAAKRTHFSNDVSQIFAMQETLQTSYFH